MGYVIKTAFFITFAMLVMVGCTDAELIEETVEIDIAEPELSEQEIAVEEIDQYVNELLDVNTLFLEIYSEAISYAQAYAPGEIDPDTPEYEELESIAARVDKEVISAFESLGSPPSEDLMHLYEIEKGYISAAQGIAEQIPMAVTGYGVAKKKLNEYLDELSQQSDLLSTTISRLKNQGVLK
ncbi:hypothetical protein [Halobacillus sp. B29]|uniref:hypothetical protein n=1 Tax=Halobacillus sp. B29 TaxID=3457432 RepID=UPI003FCDEB84